MQHIYHTLSTLILILVCLNGTLNAESLTPGTAAPDERDRGSFSGSVIDAETGSPVSFAYIHLEGYNRTATSDRDGRFRLTNIPEGEIRLVIHRLGYASRSEEYTISADEEKEVVIELRQTILSGGTVEVTARADGIRGGNLERASLKMTGSELRRNLGTTLSETLSSKPGFDQRTMGAAPARPVIRGLGDERVLILQDGERMGDVSATSADHAVSIDPVGADEIEIARGPAALAYGGNAIGGVVNVVRNQIATSVPSRTTGTATLQGSSVNSGLSAAGLLTIPRGDLVYNIDVNGRYGDDFRAPGGSIQNSGFLTSNSTAGVSYIRPWGYTGLAVSGYFSDYGIPPDADGGHPNGVDIEMRQIQIENRNEFLLSNRFFRNIETSAAFRHYNHREFETETIIGTEYIVNSGNIGVKANHRDIGFFKNGRVGLWGEVKDYTVVDRANIESVTFNSALYTIQEAEFGPFDLELGTRLELSLVQPKEERFSRLIGEIRQRTFSGLASSAALTYNAGRGWSIGGVVMHSFRPPSSEELFSQGPHIAAFTFEIGNPDIDPERGIGSELFVRYRGSRSSLEVAGFYNDFSRYIYPRDTGRESVPFPTLNEFQFESTKAELFGFEAQAEQQLSRSLVAQVSAAYTRGNRDLSDEEAELQPQLRDRDPLPMVPPFTVTGGLTWFRSGLSIGSSVRYSAAQNRPAQFEEPTDSYVVLNANAEYRHTTSGNLLHTFSIRGQNLLNQEYRNHLSRLKEIFPEPGINISLLYRLYF